MLDYPLTIKLMPARFLKAASTSPAQGRAAHVSSGLNIR
jgi:hypothetical protein